MELELELPEEGQEGEEGERERRIPFARRRVSTLTCVVKRGERRLIWAMRIPMRRARWMIWRLGLLRRVR